MSNCACDPLKKHIGLCFPNDDYQNRYLTEGCCPNRCGPMRREGELLAVCPCCKLVFRSKRLAVIWPSSGAA